jgi:glycosyltransferase involved in cell wall biosynthesis
MDSELSDRPTILCVSHVAPWPASHGNEIRLQRLLLWLRNQNWRIILVLTNQSIEPAQLELIRSNVDHLVLARPRHPLIEQKGRRYKIKRFLQIVWPARRRHFVSVNGKMQVLADQLCPAHVNSIVRRLALQEKIDIYFAYYAFTIQAFNGLPKKVKLICDTIEIFSMPRFNDEGKPITPVLSFPADEERAMLQQADLTIAIQSLEAAYLQGLLPKQTVVTVGIDSDLPSHTGVPSEAGEIIGIIGSDNLANLEGSEDFLNSCWPLIRNNRPKAKLLIAGKLGKALEAKYQDELPAGVTTLGWLASLDSFYRDLRLVVNPVVRGTGLKIKTVEALSYGRPVVSRPVGIEGIDWDGEPPWCVSADGPAMAEACIKLLADPHLCDEMAKAAKNFAVQTLSTEKVYSPLAALLDRVDH